MERQGAVFALADVNIPPAVVSAAAEHLKQFADDGPEALVFTGPNGKPTWRGNFNKLARWPEAVAAIGRPGLHFHDLRHTGTRSRPGPARAPGTSWRGWGTTRRRPR